MSREFPLSIKGKYPPQTPAPPPKPSFLPVFNGDYGRLILRQMSVIWTYIFPTSLLSTPFGFLKPPSRMKSWSVFSKLPTSISPRLDVSAMLPLRRTSPRGPSPGPLLAWRLPPPMLFPASLKPNYAPPFTACNSGRIPYRSSHSPTVFLSISFLTAGSG